MDAALWVAVVGGLFSIVVVFVTKWYEMRSTNIAVLAEVQRLIGVLEGHKKWWQHCMAKNDTGYPLLAFTTPIFDLQAKHIGQIDRKLVAQIVRFYGYLKFVNALQTERKEYREAGKTNDFNEQYLAVLEKAWGDYKEAFNPAYVTHGLVL